MNPGRGLSFRLEPRAEVTSRSRMLALAASLACALLLCALLFLAVGVDPITAWLALLQGAFGTGRAATETLVKATPLIFTGLATAIAFRARLWNIGAEGQVFAGAMLAYWCQSGLAGTSPLLQVPVIIVAAMMGGGLYGGLAAILKIRFRVDEVISTVMLNYVIVYMLSLLLLKGPWSEAGNFFEQTAKIDAGSVLPIVLAGTRLHLGFLLALIAALLAWLLLRRTPAGFEIRAAGSNLRALAVQGTDTGRVILTVMMISGGLAGLAGMSEVYGVHYRVKAGALATYGYTGIVVAILGQLSPWGVIMAAILFGALVNGATFMQIKTGVPSALIYAIEAIVLLFYLAGWAASSFRLRRLRA